VPTGVAGIEGTGTGESVMNTMLDNYARDNPPDMGDGFVLLVRRVSDYDFCDKEVPWALFPDEQAARARARGLTPDQLLSGSARAGSGGGGGGEGGRGGAGSFWASRGGGGGGGPPFWGGGGGEAPPEAGGGPRGPAPRARRGGAGRGTRPADGARRGGCEGKA